MTEPTPLLQVGALPLYPYSLTLALGVLLGLILFAVRAARQGCSAVTVVSFGLWALPLGVLGARLFYCLVRVQVLWVDYGPGFFLHFTQGGFGIMGALFGVLLAGWVCGRLHHTSPWKLLDSAVPGAALSIGVARLGEAFTLEGLGSFVENSWFQRFPFAVRHAYYDEWYIPVFLLEGLVALGIALFLWLRLRPGKNAEAGMATEWFLLLFCTSQIFLESLRQDEYLRWGFVRVNQIFCAVLILAVVMLWIRRAVTMGISLRRAAVPWLALVLLGIGLLVAVEFAIDKSAIPNVWLHLGMVGILGMMMGCALRIKRFKPVPN